MKIDKLTEYWKSIAAFFGGAVVPVIAPLTQGEWPDGTDWRMSLGLALSAAFFVAVAPANRRPGAELED